MSGVSAWAWRAVRIVYGLFFASTGAAILIDALFDIGAPPRQPTVAAQAFTDALDASGFVDPLLAAVFLTGGVALWFERTTPLGVVLLAPPVTVILFFHLFLSGQVIWGPAVAAVLVLLAWRCRAAFGPLWSFGRGGS